MIVKGVFVFFTRIYTLSMKLSFTSHLGVGSHTFFKISLFVNICFPVAYISVIINFYYLYWLELEKLLYTNCSLSSIHRICFCFQQYLDANGMEQIFFLLFVFELECLKC